MELVSFKNSKKTTHPPTTVGGCYTVITIHYYLILIIMNSVLAFSTLTSGEWVLVGLVALWSLAWTAVAVWKAARNGDKWWFIAMLVLNTVGILEIIYIFAFSKDGENPVDNNTPEA